MGAIDNENEYFPHRKTVYVDITSEDICFEYIVQFTNSYKRLYEMIRKSNPMYQHPILQRFKL